MLQATKKGDAAQRQQRRLETAARAQQNRKRAAGPQDTPSHAEPTPWHPSEAKDKTTWRQWSASNGLQDAHAVNSAAGIPAAALPELHVDDVTIDGELLVDQVGWCRNDCSST